MDHTEEYQVLEKNDLAESMRIIKFQKIAFITSGIFFPLFMFIFADISILLHILITVVSISIFGVVYCIINRYNKKVVQDYKNYKKLIIRGYIQDKFKTGYRRRLMYYIQIADRNLKVLPDVYFDFEINQRVQVSIAPVSGYIIEIKRI